MRVFFFFLNLFFAIILTLAHSLFFFNYAKLCKLVSFQYSAFTFGLIYGLTFSSNFPSSQTRPPDAFAAIWFE